MRLKISNSTALILAIGVMIIMALMRELLFFPKLDMIPNPDSSWLIYAAQRVADGQKLYVDVMETNPPLIIWISLIPVWVASFFDISPLIAFPFLVTLLNIASLLLVANIMRGKKLLNEKPVFQSVLLYISFAFFLLSPAIYGQRELLFISLVLPYLIYSLGKGKDEPDEDEPDEDEEEYEYEDSNNNENKNKNKISIRYLIIAAMAAIGFAIKPFFMLLWGVNELHLAIQRRSFKSIFSLSNWLIGFSQIAYLAMIYYFTPEYIKVIVPTILATYFAYETLWFSIWKIIAIVSGITIILVWFASPHGEYRGLISRIIIWMLACAALMLLQRKDWLNHIYPMLFMAGFAVTMLTIYLVDVWKELELMIGFRRFSALCIASVVLLAAVYVDGKFWYFIYKNPSVLHTKLLTEIDKHAAGKYVYPLTFNLQSAFPAISLSKAKFRGSFHHLWPMSGIIIREQQELKTPEITNARKFFYDTLVHDFGDFPPELVWVDENVNLEKIADYDIEPENRNIINVLTQDLRFAILWQNYKKVGEIESEAPDNKDLKKGEKERKPERYSLYTRIKK